MLSFIVCVFHKYIDLFLGKVYDAGLFCVLEDLFITVLHSSGKHKLFFSNNPSYILICWRIYV